jgi:hypothetical protein
LDREKMAQTVANGYRYDGEKGVDDPNAEVLTHHYIIADALIKYLTE